MGRRANKELVKIFTKVLKGADLLETWKAHAEPVTWGSCRRAWMVYKKAYEDEQAAAKAARARRARASSSRGAASGTPHAPPPSSGTASTRKGASVTSSARQTSHQVETSQQNKEAWRRQYSAAYKGATLAWRSKLLVLHGTSLV
jgi:hypothetical protein